MKPESTVRALNRRLAPLEFEEPVTHVYNPLEYARRSHRMYLERFAKPGVKAILLGMNPGPFGMAQTGVPFGEVAFARDWLGLEAKVERPANEHPKRPVDGYACTRSEVSGRRLWSWAQERFGTPEAFFEHFFVWNYCPLAFLEESGRNRTPDKLPASEREPLFEACDEALHRIVDFMEPEFMIGVGKFAQTRAQQILGPDARVETILHPSPASPIANRGWAPQVDKQLEAMGLGELHARA